MRFHPYLSLIASYLIAQTFAVSQDDLFANSLPPLEDSSSMLEGSSSLLEAPLIDDSPDLFDAKLPEITVSQPLNDLSLNQGCSSIGSDQMIGKNKSKKRGESCASHLHIDDYADDEEPEDHEDEDYWEDFNLDRVLLQRLEKKRASAGSKLNLGLCPPPLMPLCCEEIASYMGVTQSPCFPCK